MGQMDVNTIFPFSVAGRVDRRAQNGTYPIVITITYRDNYNNTGTISAPTTINVGASRTSGTVTQQPQQTLIVGMTPIGLIFYAALAIIAAATTAIIWRNQKKTGHKLSLRFRRKHAEEEGVE